MTAGGDVEVLIAGAGASGLTLAWHLVRAGWGERRMVLVDDGRTDPADQAWSFWSDRADPLDAAVVRTWERVAVHAAGRRLDRPLAPYRYRLVTGASLRAATEGLLATAPGLQRWRGTVQSVVDGPAGAVVTVDGRQVPARWVFDSVSPPVHGGVVTLAFVGWEVAASRPAFDPGAVTLLDFRTPQRAGPTFVYVLPMSRERALVEHTRFAVAGSTGADPDDDLHAYLARVVGSGRYDVLRVEGGRLPLGGAPRRTAGGSVLPIGITGGRLKASTGYAYTRILRDAAAIARSMARHGQPYDLPVPPRRHAYLDRVLLELVAGEPAALEPAFARLFGDNPPARVLRFLDGDTTVGQEARLVAALPRAPFLRAAARLAGRPGGSVGAGPGTG